MVINFITGKYVLENWVLVEAIKCTRNYAIIEVHKPRAICYSRPKIIGINNIKTNVLT